MNIFNEGLIDTELFWLSFGDIISNMVIATVIIAEIGFVIWLLLKWLRGNVKFNWSPEFHIGESARRRTDSLIETFEKKICKTVGAKFGVANNSGTSSLHIGCIALDLKPNQYLWTAGNSFVASANCGRYCGANIDFVDINPDTFNIDPDILEHKLKNTPKNFDKMKIGGITQWDSLANMNLLMALEQAYSIRLSLVEMPEVKEAHILFGEWDIIALLDMDSPEHLGSFVMEHIRSLPGVKLTSTMIVAR